MGYATMEEGHELRLVRAFAARLPDERSRWRKLIERSGEPGTAVAMFGAGHAGIMFVNALGLKDHLACAIDDHPAKQGLRLPGSRLPILPSSSLLGQDVRVCLLAVDPASEDNVIRALAPWLAAGGRASSIFPWSRRYAASEVT